MADKRKTYTKEFKKDVLAMLETSTKTQREIEHDMGLPEGIISRWKRLKNQHEEKAFPGRGNPVEAELAAMKKKLAETTLERDILKKALAIFSKETSK